MDTSAKWETRRHDLDALRAFAMLLGILLHAMMSFLPGIWMVQDAASNPGVGVVVMMIHGFRMPLFFLVSGFFTALLWRQRGLKALIQHRLLRILAPCVLGVLTIVPLYHLVVQRAVTATPPVSAASPVARTLAEAALQGDVRQVRSLLAAGTDPNTEDSKYGATPLSLAALRGDGELARLLIVKGARVRQANRDDSTPLHCAAILGNDAVARLLLQNGADVHARTKRDETPAELTYIDTATTQRLIGLLGLPSRSPENIEEGRKRCRALLPAAVPKKMPLLDSLRARYGAFLLAPYFATPIFEHLWFLWYLCWLLPLFVVWTRLVERVPAARRWVVSPLRYLWLIPVSLIPQAFMGINAPSLGPDTYVGLVPPPHLLAYYAVFFFFGALYYEADDSEGTLGRRWWLTLPLALFLVLPLGMATMTLLPPLSGPLQIVYSWLMVIGSLGLARRVLSQENATLRYLSDASYWLYLAHLPLVVAVQLLIRDLALPLPVKLLIILSVSLVALLASYQLFVRYGALGTLLNGRRTRLAAVSQGHPV